MAACCEALLGRTLLSRRLARHGGLADLTPQQRERLCVFAALHDLGKVNRGFQNKALPLGQRPFGAGHIKPVAALLSSNRSYPEKERLLEAISAGDMVPWCAGDDGSGLLEMLLATLSHHGRPVALHEQPDSRYWTADQNYDPFAAIAELVLLTRQWFPLAWQPGGEPLPPEPEFQHAFAGLLILADWLGSDSERFPFSSDPATDRMPFARERASAVMRELGLDPASFRAALGPALPRFRDFAPGLSPRETQRLVGELQLEPEGSLVILEAETGSGKTEAALLHFLRLFHASAVDGIYFALPTRTAATQIYERMQRAVGNVFPERSRPPVVQAVPGYLVVDGVRGAPLPHFRVLWPDEGAMRWRAWAGEHPKRYFAGAVVVGTVDQVLLSALAVSHAHLRATALLRQLLVVDEVHASDAYMTRILEQVLRFHLAPGGHALLMSATLGSAARCKLASSQRSRTEHPSRDEAVRVPYPLVSVISDAKSQAFAVPASEEKRVLVERSAIAEEPGAVAAAAFRAARAGAKVLVVRNTVSACQATQEALEELAAHPTHPNLFSCQGVVAPHHGRYAREDRLLLDEAIEAAFGKQRDDGGLVAVATQTVEQSLDLDADLLLTDLCPFDVLLQRIGRLHRHARPRPAGYEIARFVVLLPTERDLSQRILPSGEARGANGLGSVYEDLRVLEATWRELEAREDLVVPRDNRALVEAATHPEPLAAVSATSPAWTAHGNWIQGSLLAERRVADLNLVARHLPFGDQAVLFPSGDTQRRIPTRLGEEDRLIHFAEPWPSPFGVRVEALRLPFHLLPRALATDADMAESVAVAGCVTSFSFGNERYRYDRLGLRRDSEQNEKEEPTREEVSPRKHEPHARVKQTR